MASHSQHETETPSSWVRRFAPLIRAGGQVLDIACGRGRHARYLAGLGCRVDAVDRAPELLENLRGVAGVKACAADLEAGAWPYEGRRFDAIVVANYLHRPLFPRLLAALAPGGLLIYETFAAGNERHGRPRNPDFLLRRGELLELARGRLRVLAFEDLEVEDPRPAAVQRICALNDESVA